MNELYNALKAASAAPPDAPIGLPGAAYTDAACFEQERAGVLRDSWHCLGRADEIPNPGDYFTVQLLDEPLLIVRGDDGEIRVLSNICRHRAMPVADGAGNAKRFVCAYHAWTYGRDGALLRAPRMHNAVFDPKTCSLPQVRSRQWRGFIQATLGDASPPDEPELEGLIDAYEPQTMRLIHQAEEIWATNWKCLVENFMEAYHLSVVHPETLHHFTPTGLAKKSAAGRGFTSYLAHYPKDAPSRGHGAPGLTAEQRHLSTLFAVFPTQVASLSASMLVSLSIFPETVDRIRVRWTASVRDGDLDEATIDARLRNWEEVNREDREKLERMQIGLRSAFAGAGPLAGEDYEGPIRDFHRWLAETMN